MKIELDKTEQNNKLTKERVIQNIIDSINHQIKKTYSCAAMCHYMNDIGNCVLAGEEVLEYKDGVGFLRTESCLTLKPILSDLQTLKDFHNKLLNNQKQNDMDVDVDSIIFDKEK